MFNNVIAAERAIHISETGRADDDEKDHRDSACGGVTDTLEQIESQSPITNGEQYGSKGSHGTGLTGRSDTEEDRAFNHENQ